MHLPPIVPRTLPPTCPLIPPPILPPTCTRAAKTADGANRPSFRADRLARPRPGTKGGRLARPRSARQVSLRAVRRVPGRGRASGRTPGRVSGPASGRTPGRISSRIGRCPWRVRVPRSARRFGRVPGADYFLEGQGHSPRPQRLNRPGPAGPSAPLLPDLVRYSARCRADRPPRTTGARRQLAVGLFGSQLAAARRAELGRPGGTTPGRSGHRASPAHAISARAATDPSRPPGHGPSADGGWSWHLTPDTDTAARGDRSPQTRRWKARKGASSSGVRTRERPGSSGGRTPGAVCIPARPTSEHATSSAPAASALCARARVHAFRARDATARQRPQGDTPQEMSDRGDRVLNGVTQGWRHVRGSGDGQGEVAGGQEAGQFAVW